MGPEMPLNFIVNTIEWAHSYPEKIRHLHWMGPLKL